MASCCPTGCTGSEILCVTIPSPVTIVLLGTRLQLELPCLRLTSAQDLTSEQITALLNLLAAIIGGIGGLIPATT